MIQTLSSEIVRDGFNIVTGLGLGVGQLVINGGLVQLEHEGTRRMDERLIMRPFPQGFASAAERRRRWTNYRMEMLSQAGIAIFLFGNKQDDDGRIIDADGMEEEFRLAAAAGLKVLPIGCTGHVAARLHKEVLATFSNYYPVPGIKQLFTELGKRGTPKQVVDRIVAIVRKIRGQNN